MINRVIVSGFLWAEADSAYTPGGQEKLVFDVGVGQSGGDGVCGWRAVVESPELIGRLRGRLVRGVRVVIEGELGASRFERHGVLAGWRRFLRVQRCEVGGSVVVTEPEPELVVDFMGEGVSS